MGTPKVYSGDTRYLMRKAPNGVWYVTVDVPRSAQKIMGKKRMVQSLQTADLGAAQQLRWPIIAELKEQIAVTVNPPLPTADLHDRAMEARKDYMATPTPSEEVVEAIDVARRGVEEKHGDVVAEEFYKLATGQADALDASVANYLLGANIAQRTAADLKTALAELTDWAKGNKKPVIVQAFTSRNAAEFRDGFLLPVKKNVRTINKKISLLSSYWKWMAKNGVLDQDRPNPWTGKSLPKPKAWQQSGDKTDMRPFTNDEVKTLLYGDADDDIADLMRISALSGLRLEEIGQLRVKECKDGVFDITRSKTEAGIRQVPIHSALVELVSKRTKGQPEDAFIFPDFEASGWDDARTMAISKRFGRYRKKLGVDDTPKGLRRSRVDFHSFRRWFARQCEENGEMETLVARIMGHKKDLGMTFGTYSKARPIDLMRTAVEGVKLPIKPTVST